MLATSHKPFAFKILTINLYSSKILAAFTAKGINILDSSTESSQDGDDRAAEGTDASESDGDGEGSSAPRSGGVPCR
jgi:hypothetical protein